MAKTRVILGGYAAKTCDVITQLDFDSSADGRKVPDSPAVAQRKQEGIEFEAVVFAQLKNFYGSAIVEIRAQRDEAKWRQETLEAMDSDVQIILGGNLPEDVEGKRTGRPDLLIRASGGWIPADVKHHGIVKPSDKGTANFTPLDQLLATEPYERFGHELTSNAHGDVMQLAHYWRMLEACGRAANVPRGAIIGSDLNAWWFDLEAPEWGYNRTIFDIYDREFATRIAIAKNQLARNTNPQIDRLVLPMWHSSECSECAWRAVCLEELDNGVDRSISFLPGTRVDQCRALAVNGVQWIRELALVDRRAVWLMTGDKSSETKVDLSELASALEGREDGEALGDVLGKAKKVRLRRLEELGLSTVGDARTLDFSVARFVDAGVTGLGKLIDEARANMSGSAFLARGIDRVSVVRADVEVDVDMENAESGGVYLWGALHSSKHDGYQPTYRPFVSWDPLTWESEARLFDEFWTWLLSVRAAALERGETFAAYVYYANAEDGKINAIKARGYAEATYEEIDEIRKHPGHWNDLHPVAKDQITTGRDNGLKQVAPLSGFSWRDVDPGGEQSMGWYQLAVFGETEEIRAANRERLLQYNEDDVRATYSLRHWFSTHPFEKLPD